jgi:hypothetical protein
MSDLSITIPAGTSKRLLVRGTFPRKNIVVTAESNTGGDEGWIGDGNTHIWISLAEGRTSPMLGVGVKGTVTVDWGDGTTPDVLTGTSAGIVQWTPNHEYAKAGDYVITLTVDGEMGLFGSGNGSGHGSYILRHSSTGDYRNYVYQAALKKIEIGNGVTSISNNAFKGLEAIESVAISDSVTSIYEYAFENCYALQGITIPNSVTSIGKYAFRYSGILSITIPDSVTSIGNGCFNGCECLASIVIPSSISLIGGSTFAQCYSVKFYDFTSHTSVPALSSVTAFSNLPADCEIRVPAALYDEWIAATNWATYASYIKAV